MYGIRPWEMHRLTFEVLGAIERDLRARRQAEQMMDR
jgi:hypothetical protein